MRNIGESFCVLRSHWKVRVRPEMFLSYANFTTAPLNNSRSYDRANEPGLHTDDPRSVKCKREWELSSEGSFLT